MFIIPVSEHKKEASSLKKHLEEYGITSFVAHEDIRPSREWIREIEKALNSMDCMVAIMYDEFPKSNWCDQEVGIALGRNVTVIPILINNKPYGFIGEYQGIKAKGIKPSEIAESVFKVICDNPNTRNKYMKVITNLFLQSEDKQSAVKWWNLISKIEKVPVDVWSMISQNIVNNKFLMAQQDIIDKINVQLTANSLKPIRKKDDIITIHDEDLPF